ncbi:MAG: FAD:protein FMN transferase, partial [Thermoleophilia bacterium]|nr:FAD:protein FMN transferase [Thermoleophilia bacterium]
QLLPRDTRFVVDCGGDIRVGALPAHAAPYEIDVETEQIGPGQLTLTMHSGAVATSGIGSRLWRRDDGDYAHHVIDPATGRSAWTGLTSVTAIAPTALEAETIAKTALLMGPEGSRQVLAVGGGATVDYDGKVEVIAPSPVPAQPAPGRRDSDRAADRTALEAAA